MARIPYGNNSYPLKKCTKNTKGLVGTISSIIKLFFIKKKRKFKLPQDVWLLSVLGELMRKLTN